MCKSKMSAQQLARIDEAHQNRMMVRAMHGMEPTFRLTGETDESLSSPDMTDHVWPTNSAPVALAETAGYTPLPVSQSGMASESPDTRSTGSESATQSANTQGLYDFSAVQTW